MTYIGEEFQKRFKTLPEDIQRALTAVASVDTIFAIGKKHGLMVDQIGKMADEIWKVMLGLANPKDFIRNLASTLGIESEKASAIASEVNAQMFQQVRESLRRLYDQAPAPNSQLPAPSKVEQKIDTETKKLEAESGKPARPAGGLEAAPAVPPMIYPQDRFEEPRMSDLEGRTKEEPEQLAPPPPVVVPITPPSPPYPKGGDKEDNKIPTLNVRGGEGELLYPEKMKEVSRESAAGQGGYKGRDPYRELID